jgi:hypothetical protein
MAKKNTTNNPNETSFQVPVPNQDQAATDWSGAIKKGGKAAGNTNRADTASNAQSSVDYLQNEGIGLVDATLQGRIDGITKTSAKQLSPYNKTLLTTESRIRAAAIKRAGFQDTLDDPESTDKEKAKATAGLEKLTETEKGLNKKLETTNRSIKSITDASQASLDKITPNAPKLTDLLPEKYPEAAKALASAQPYIAKMGQLGVAGEALGSALSKGYTAGNIAYNAATAAKMGTGQTIGTMNAARVADINAVNAARVADISSRDVGGGALGGQLMGEAQRRVSLNGQLSEQATRDAIQSARQGFAARGMATGNAALGAELLNRDRYSNARAMQDLGFANTVQESDIMRQARNAEQARMAAEANQRTSLGLSLSDQQAAMDAQKANQSTATTLSLADLNAAMEGAKANQTDFTNRDVAQLGQDNYVNVNNASQDLAGQNMQQENLRLEDARNIGKLGDAYNLDQKANDEKLRGVMLNSGLESAANPNNMMMSFIGANKSDVGTQSIGPAAGLVANTGALINDANAFNTSSNMWQAYQPLSMGQYGSQQSGAAGGGWSGAATGALSGAAMGSVAGPYGAAAGAVVGGAAGYFSDKRLKKNIKENEYGLEDISKLKTYQYDYKDGADNEAGVMAQELRKVMPEAVTEAEMMDGKKKVKRLMIKPMFLTAALVNSVKELNEKVAALGSSVKAPKPKTSKALGEALMELV